MKLAPEIAHVLSFYPKEVEIELIFAQNVLGDPFYHALS